MAAGLCHISAMPHQQGTLTELWPHLLFQAARLLVAVQVASLDELARCLFMGCRGQQMFFPREAIAALSVAASCLNSESSGRPHLFILSPLQARVQVLAQGSSGFSKQADVQGRLM